MSLRFKINDKYDQGSTLLSRSLTAISVEKLQPKAHTVALALVAFILSFVVARTFTTFSPSTVFISGGIHIHHFWYGIVLLAIGGWLGISYNNRETDRVAAILYGAGGGLIIDEVGLLLTFGNYWTSITFTFMFIFLAFITILILLNKYRRTILSDFEEFASSKASLYFGVFIVAISVAFITETGNLLITIISSGLTIMAIIVILAYLIQRIRKRD